MILNNNDSTLDVLGLKKINIEVNNLTFNSLIDRIYNYKLEAVIREVSTNALDAHKDSGIITPFKISLFYNNDTSSVTKISIKDFGKGLTAEEMELYLATLNSSSKRDSNDQVGCLGLGAKSPFSITTKFQYISIKDGIKSILDFERVENETPRYEIRSEETDEESGTECIIPCSFELDKVIRAIQTQLVVFPIKPEIIQYNSDFTVEDLSNIFFDIDEYETFSVIHTDLCQFDNVVYVQMGPVLYRVPEGILNSYKRTDNQVFIIKADLGEFVFNDGREYIQLNDSAQINKFLNKLKVIYEATNLDRFITEVYHFYRRDGDISLLREYARDEEKFKILSYPFFNLFNLNNNFYRNFINLLNANNSLYTQNFLNIKQFYDFIKTVKYSSNCREVYNTLIKYSLFYRGTLSKIYPKEFSSKTIYLLETTATKSSEYLNSLGQFEDLDRLLVISRKEISYETYEYFKRNFDLDYEFKTITIKDLKLLYPSVYESIKRVSKPRVKKVSSDESNSTTSDGFISGEKYIINYLYKDDEDVLTINQTARQIKLSFKKLLNSWFSNILVFPKELVATQEDKALIESIICKAQSLRVYEIDNEVDFNIIINILKSVDSRLYNYVFKYNVNVNKYIIDYYQIREHWDELNDNSMNISPTLTQFYYRSIFNLCFNQPLSVHKLPKEFIDYIILKILGEEGIEEFKTKYVEYIKPLPKELINGLH